MKIDLVLGAILYKSRVRPLNPDQKDNLRKQIDKWLEEGVIKPSVSPWASLLAPVKKKNGRGKWVTDLIELNKQTFNRNRIGEVWRICLRESTVLEVWSLCNQSDVGGHRGIEGKLNKFLEGFFMLSVRQKIHFLKKRM